MLPGESKPYSRIQRGSAIKPPGLCRTEPNRYISVRYERHKIHRKRDAITKYGNIKLGQEKAGLAEREIS